jgi:hypothetical protein
LPSLRIPSNFAFISSGNPDDFAHEIGHLLNLYHSFERLNEAAREREYEKWKEATGMENEGRTPFSFGTRGIAGGLQIYHEIFNNYPQGENREIAKALFGENPHKLRILNWPERKLSAEGEFLDPWGTAYLIQVQGDKIEIRSAGPNRNFWDSDDQVAK